MCYVGLDEMRQACGGAGFLLSSGIADWWADIAPFPTFEGVNPVMVQQASRLIFKQADKVAKNKKPLEFFAYLVETPKLMVVKSGAVTITEFLDMDHIEKALCVRAAIAVREVTKLMNESTAHIKEKENEIFAIDIARMTRLHFIYATLRMGRQRLDSHKFTDLNVKTYLILGLKVFALRQLLLDSQSLYETGFFGLGSGRLLDLSYRELLNQMRP